MVPAVLQGQGRTSTQMCGRADRAVQRCKVALLPREARCQRLRHANNLPAAAILVLHDNNSTVPQLKHPDNSLGPVRHVRRQAPAAAAKRACRHQQPPVQRRRCKQLLLLLRLLRACQHKERAQAGQHALWAEGHVTAACRHNWHGAPTAACPARCEAAAGRCVCDPRSRCRSRCRRGSQGTPALPAAALPLLLITAAVPMLLLLLLCMLLHMLVPRPVVPVVPLSPRRQQALPPPVQAVVIAASLRGWESRLGV